MIIYNHNLNNEKKLYYELVKIYGIGHKLSYKICNKCNLLTKIVRDVTKLEFSLLLNELNKFKLEKDLKLFINNNINNLINSKSYRGYRHSLGLPVRGQRTRTNAKTSRKKSC